LKPTPKPSPSRLLPCLCAFALCAPPAALAATAEPALRLDPALTPPAAEFPADERALLRVEYQAAQARDAEADVLGDILQRVRNINGMINDLHGIVTTWPIAGSAAPVPVRNAAADIAPPPAEEAGATVPEMAIRAAMAAVIVFLFWLLGRRHFGKSRRLAAAAAATPTVMPENEAPAEKSMASPAPAAEPIHALVAHPVAEPPAMPQPEAVPAPQPAKAAHDQVVVLHDQTLVLDALDFHLPETDAAQPATDAAPAPEPDAGPDQSIELAEIMVSMGLAQGAADALTERIRANPKRALYHWLKLLEIYRRSQRKEDFERAAQELRQTFNVQPAAWGGAIGSFSIEDFPHLSNKLQKLWPRPECAAFLGHLLEDNRGGTRNGLPQCVAEEILLLEQMLGTETLAAAA
jgi:hypothetical protein